MFKLSRVSVLPPDHKGASKPRNHRSRRRNKLSGRSKVEPTVPKPHDAPMSKSDLYFALDCEMVGVGQDGLDSALARVSIVNWDLETVLDTFVKVNVPVTDYRTHVSGVTAKDLESPKAMEFEDCRLAVKNILCGKILIGHGLENDLNALGLTHPRSDVRDTAAYAPLMRKVLMDGKMVFFPRKLRDLAWEQLERQIQTQGSAHSPIEDAITALDLYKSVRPKWEEDLVQAAMRKSLEEETLRLESQLYANQVHHLNRMAAAQQQHAAQVNRENYHKLYYNRGYPVAPQVQYVPQAQQRQPPPTPRDGYVPFDGTAAPPPDVAYPYGYPAAPPPPPQASSFFRLPQVPVYLSRRSRRQQQQQRPPEQVAVEQVAVAPTEPTLEQ